MSNHEPLIISCGETLPEIDPSAYIAPTAVLIGETVIHEDAGIYFNCVLRGDINRIEVGSGSNIQDLTMMHVDDGYPCIVGRNVTVGHSALLHGCVVEDGCLIGMGSVVLTGAVIGTGSIIAAGTVVPERMVVPPRSLVAGVPGVIKKQYSERTADSLKQWAIKYQKVSRGFKTGCHFRPNWGLEIELD